MVAPVNKDGTTHMELLGQLNDLIWNPMAYLALGLGLFFTVLTRGIQFRRVPDMFRALREGRSTDEGTSPLQAVMLGW